MKQMILILALCFFSLALTTGDSFSCTKNEDGIWVVCSGSDSP